MSEKSREYWAFLSYSHADAGAARLHRELERYVLPRRLRLQYGLPRRLAPVFRDAEELAAGSSLSERLRVALDRSRWLVVLCSSRSAQSRHVADEISYFIARHGAGRVLCAWVDGEWPASLPLPLRSLSSEPLAADFRRPADFKVALLKLVACISGVGFSELKDRERERRRRLYAVAAGVGFTFAAGALLTWDLTSRTQVEHYARVTQRYGTWKGVEPVSAKAAAPHFRFLRHGRLNPPSRVDYLGPDGTCPEGGMDDVLLVERHAGDRSGQIHPICRVAFEYADGSIAYVGFDAVQAEDNGNSVGFLMFMGDQRGKSGLAQAWVRRKPGHVAAMSFVAFSRDAHGFDATVRFMKTPGQPTRDRHGHYGYSFQRDEYGVELSRSPLDDAAVR